MVVIYSQDKTYIRTSIRDAENEIVTLYGETIGSEAINALKNARDGFSWRKNGGPLIQVVNTDKAKWIAKKEAEIGML